MTDLKKEFWKRIDGVRAGMLGVKGQGRLVAMSPQVDDDYRDQIFFITAKGTDLAKAVETGDQAAQFVVADADSGLCADVEGTLRRSVDREALDEVWSFVSDAWFEGGQHDPDVCLLQFTPAHAEVSVTNTSGVKFLYEIAKANLTEEKPDVGSQGTVTF